MKMIRVTTLIIQTNTLSLLTCSTHVGMGVVVVGAAVVVVVVVEVTGMGIAIIHTLLHVGAQLF